MKIVQPFITVYTDMYTDMYSVHTDVEQPQPALVY